MSRTQHRPSVTARRVAAALVAVPLVLLVLLAGPPSRATASTAATATPRTPAAVAPPAAAADVDLTRIAGNEAENAVAVNPADPRNVVMMSTYSPTVAAAPAKPHRPVTGPAAAIIRGLTLSVTHDGGATWRTRVIGTGGALGQACCDESIAFDGYGNLFMTYLFLSNGNVPVALSTDGGDTISPLTTTTASADQPTITTGPGSVWLTWTAGNGGITLAGAKVTGRGHVGAFTQESVPRPYNAGDYGDVAVSPTGAVIVTYQQNTSVTDGPNIVFTSIDPDGLGPHPLQAEKPFVITGVGSFDFIPAQPNRSIDAETAMAYDQTAGAHRGRLYAMWTAESPNESDNTDVLLRWSDDNGLHWSGNVRLDDDQTRRSQFLPKLAVDQSTGHVGACWYDARNDGGNGGVADTDGVANDDAMVYCTVSRDGGRTFGPNIRVSAKASHTTRQFNEDFDYGDYEGLGFGGGVLRPAWSDNSNSAGGNPDGTLRQLDLYTAAIHGQ